MKMTRRVLFFIGKWLHLCGLLWCLFSLRNCSAQQAAYDISTVATNITITYNGYLVTDYSGFMLGSVGDVNGDGINDFGMYNLKKQTP